MMNNERSFSNQGFEKHNHYSLFILQSSLFIIYYKRGFSSAGRAPALQAGGQRFEPANLHQMENRGRAKAPAPEKMGQ